MSHINDVLRKFSDKFKVILITGGAGAIGSNLVNHLLKSKVKKIIIVDDLSSGYKTNIPKDKKVSFVKGDIADIRLIKKIFKNFKIEVVFHLAAHFANQNSIEHPVLDLKTNGVGTINLLENAVKYKVKKFIYFSTSCVYKTRDERMRESELDFQFETPYAISKYIGEKYTKFYHDHYGLPTVNLRIFNSFGPGERAGLYRNVIPNFFFKAMRGQSLVITGTGRESRNFTFVDDIVRGALLAALASGAIGKTINLGGNRSITVNELASAINILTGNKKKVLYRPRRNWDHTTSRKGSLELAEDLLGFRAEISFEIGLEKTYQFFRKDSMVNKRTSK